MREQAASNDLTEASYNAVPLECVFLQTYVVRLKLELVEPASPRRARVGGAS